MDGLNTMAFIWFGFLHQAAGWLCELSAQARAKALKILGLTLLAGNCLLYALPLVRGQGLRLPAEFSAVAYFMVPLLILAGRGKAGAWAAYSGLMAGFFYFFAMILQGQVLYGAYAPSSIYLSMFNHGILYLLGLTAIRVRLYPQADRRILTAGIVCVASWALAVRPWIEEPGKLLIYKLLEAPALREALPQAGRIMTLPLYYLGLALAIGLSFRLFFFINRQQCRSCQKDGRLRVIPVS